MLEIYTSRRRPIFNRYIFILIFSLIVFLLGFLWYSSLSNCDPFYDKVLKKNTFNYVFLDKSKISLGKTYEYFNSLTPIINWDIDQLVPYLISNQRYLGYMSLYDEQNHILRHYILQLPTDAVKSYLEEEDIYYIIENNLVIISQSQENIAFWHKTELEQSRIKNYQNYIRTHRLLKKHVGVWGIINQYSLDKAVNSQNIKGYNINTIFDKDYCLSGKMSNNIFYYSFENQEDIYKTSNLYSFYFPKSENFSYRAYENKEYLMLKDLKLTNILSSYNLNKLISTGQSLGLKLDWDKLLKEKVTLLKFNKEYILEFDESSFVNGNFSDFLSDLKLIMATALMEKNYIKMSDDTLRLDYIVRTELINVLKLDKNIVQIGDEEYKIYVKNDKGIVMTNNYEYFEIKKEFGSIRLPLFKDFSYNYTKSDTNSLFLFNENNKNIYIW